MSADRLQGIDSKTLVKVIKIQETRFGFPIYPWRTRRLAVGDERVIRAVTDRPDDYGSDTHIQSAEVFTTIRSVARDRAEVAQEIRPFGESDSTPTNDGLREITLNPHEPVVVRIGWGRAAKVTML